MNTKNLQVKHSRQTCCAEQKQFYSIFYESKGLL